MAPRVLIVDDDPEIASALARGLSLHGYEGHVEHGLAGALGQVGEGFDAAIVDVMIGPDSGLDLVREIRGRGIGLPVVMLSALSEVEDRAAGLEAGADDYIVKPFAFEELVARLKVQLRRARAPARARLDPVTRTLAREGHASQLTEREFGLLRMLAAHPGEALSRGALFDALWKGEGTSSENVVDVYVGYLRKKIDPAMGFEIKTLRNRGFCLEGVPPEVAQVPDKT